MIPFDPPNHYNVKRIIKNWDKKSKKQDIEDILQAYSDNNERPGPRNLDFISKYEYSLPETIEIMGKALQRTGGYNNFTPDLLSIFRHYPTIKFRIAREGSVALYITHPKSISQFIEEPDIIRELMVDEYQEDPKGYRLWWD